MIVHETTRESRTIRRRTHKSVISIITPSIARACDRAFGHLADTRRPRLIATCELPR
jgi:hypothetical protein